MSNSHIETCLFIILGATGNLTRKKLFPALYHLSTKGILKGKIKILGVARRELNDHGYRALARKMLESMKFPIDHKIYSMWCESCLHYHSLGKGNYEDYEKLATTIKTLERKYNLPGNRIFYIAIPPTVFTKSIVGLGKAGLNKSPGWTRIVVEKPFGWNLTSAKELNKLVHRYFDESQIYRIDHFLAKETVQNLLVFRFANTIFEHLWNRDHIESIEINVAENVGIEDRANYYEQTGALRDMIQNHLTQLLTLIAMEPPLSFKAGAIRNEKAKVLRQIAPIQLEHVVFGQYIRGTIDGVEVVGYQDEPGVSFTSQTETFVTLKLGITNWRWKGVPFYLRTGKRMSKKLTQIIINLHCVPISIFHPFESTCSVQPNTITITLQPDEGFDILFQVKAIGQPITLTNQRLHFRYSESFGALPDAYEILLLDILIGDQTLFVRYDEVEDAWRIYNSVLEKNVQVYPYPAGTSGPPEANDLIKRNNKLTNNVT
jgi:glucose-6-phosphate 1-dehydrogenase